MGGGYYRRGGRGERTSSIHVNPRNSPGSSSSVAPALGRLQPAVPKCVSLTSHRAVKLTQFSWSGRRYVHFPTLQPFPCAAQSLVCFAVQPVPAQKPPEHFPSAHPQP